MILSKKKRTELYDTVHEEIMQARTKIFKMNVQNNICVAEIDDILGDLCKSCPEKAIHLFGSTPRNRK